MGRCCKFDIFTLRHDVNGAWSHLVFVFGRFDVRNTAWFYRFIPRRFICRACCRHKCGKEALNDSRLNFCFGISLDLQQRFYNVRKVRNAPILSRSFRRHDMQDIRQPALFSNRNHPLNFSLCEICIVERIIIRDVIGHDLSGFVHFHTVIDHVSIFCLCCSKRHLYCQIIHTRRSHSVRFDQLKAQRIWLASARLFIPAQ